MDLNVEVHLV